MSDIVIKLPDLNWGIDPDFQQCIKKCRKCGEKIQISFLVDDVVWYATTADFWHALHREDGVLCLMCFDELAAEKNIRYTPTSLFFIGRQCSFEFRKHSANHINGSDW